jgi:hypothetical protein
MKNCSFCGKENHNDANFCTNCGRTFVIKELRKNLGLTFEIIGYVAIGLGFLAFIFELITMIIARNGIFSAYVMWLVKFIMLGLVTVAFLYAHKIKSHTLSVYTAQALIAHMLIFFPIISFNNNGTNLFLGFSNTFRLVFMLILIYLAVGVIFAHLKSEMGERILRYYQVITATASLFYTLIAFLGLCIFGFRSALSAFSTLSMFAYLAAISSMLVLPIIDRTIDIVERQGNKEEVDVEIVD